MAQDPCRVLIVEDDDLIRRLMTVVLERGGYTVASAPTGSAAIDLMTGLACAPDLILLDYDLPDMTAREVRAAQLG